MKLSYYQLDDALQSKAPAELPPVFVIGGDQDLLRELAVARIVACAVGAEPSPFAFEKFDGESSSDDAIVGSANQMPMLGGRRAVVVKRAQKLVEKSEALARYVADPSPTTVLVLELSKSPDRRRKAWKQIEKATTIVACDAPAPAELEEWVNDQARLRAMSLGRDAVRYLIAEFGSDLRRLTSELEKLSLYAGGERLDPESIATVLGRGKAQSVFKFIDAVGAGEASRALRQLGRLLEEGEPPFRILALLDRLVGQLRMAHEANTDARSGSVGQGREGSGMAKLLGVPPSTARVISDASKRFDAGSLAKAMEGVSFCDRVLKSSSLSPRIALESLTLSLCAAGGSKPLNVGGRRRR